MNVISIKDYAKQRNVSYEAIRQQVVRYAAELGDHIIKDGRQQFLDEEAVAFLDEKRKKNPVVLYEVAKDEEIERLKEEKEALLLKLASVQDQLIRAQDENKLLIEENKKVFLLQANNQQLEKEKEDALTVAEINAQERDQERKRAEKAEKEAELSEIENDAVWKRIERIKNRSLLERIFNKNLD